MPTSQFLKDILASLKQISKKTNRQTGGQMNTQPDGQTGRQTDRQTDRNRDVHKNRRTDRHTEGYLNRVRERIIRPIRKICCQDTTVKLSEKNIISLHNPLLGLIMSELNANLVLRMPLFHICITMEFVCKIFLTKFNKSTSEIV